MGRRMEMDKTFSTRGREGHRGRRVPSRPDRRHSGNALERERPLTGETNMKNLTIVALLLLVGCIATSAFGHHSAAGIDRTKTVTVEGVVKEFKWANPHSWLDVQVPNSKGGTDLWSFEMNPPAYLVRS